MPTVELKYTSGTWTAPDGVSEVTVEAWGAGGGTGPTPNNNAGVGGAGGGAYAIRTFPVTSGLNYSFTIGLAGDATGSNGGDSYWTDGSNLFAQGGRGTTLSTSGLGGSINASLGDTIYPGGNGANSAGTSGGGGGSGAGSTGAGNPGSGVTGGSPRTEYGGAGGNGSSGAGQGQPGSVYGGGAGGSYRSGGNQSGQPGANGLIRITYTEQATNPVYLQHDSEKVIETQSLITLLKNMLSQDESTIETFAELVLIQLTTFSSNDEITIETQSLIKLLIKLLSEDDSQVDTTNFLSIQRQLKSETESSIETESSLAKIINILSATENSVETLSKLSAMLLLRQDSSIEIDSTSTLSMFIIQPDENMHMGTFILQDFNDTTFYAEYSATGLEGSWHYPFQEGDLYMRTRVSQEAWGPAIRIVGEDGVSGQDGEPGQDGSYVEYQFSKNTSTTIAPTTGWQASPPTLNVGEYLWMRTGTVFPPNTSPATWSSAVRISGDAGNDGISITGIVERYLATSASSGVTTATPGWTITMQNMTVTNKYLWNYRTITFSDTEVSTIPPIIIGVYGNTGDTGATGRALTTITEYYLASASASGVTRATSGWNTAMQTTTTTNKYLWNYRKLDWSIAPLETFVEPIIIGVHGATGSTGATGVGISSTVVTYQVGTSGTIAPTGTWSSSVPSVPDNQFLWTRIVINYTSGSPTTSYAVGKMGAEGPTGVGLGDTSIMYQAHTSGTVAPTGTWSPSIPPVADNQFLWTRLIISYSDTTSSTLYSVAKMGAQGPQGSTGTTGAPGKTYSVAIVGGIRTITYNLFGSLPVPTMTAFSIEIFEDNIAVTPTARSWSVPADSMLTGTSTAATFTPGRLATYDGSKMNNRVDAVVTYAGIAHKVSVPIAVVREGPMLDWVQEWDTNATAIGAYSIVSPKIFVGSGGATPTGISLGVNALNNAIANNIMGYKDGVLKYTLNEDYFELIGDGTNRAGLSSVGTAGTEIRIWAGGSFANRATAKFRVNQLGELNATGATISGAITVTGGNAETTTGAQTKVNTLEGTLIEGGLIRTNLLSASRIVTGTLDASLATITNINANNITTGLLSAERLNIALGGRNTLFNSDFAKTNLILPDGTQIESIAVSDAGFAPVYLYNGVTNDYWHFYDGWYFSHPSTPGSTSTSLHQEWLYSNRRYFQFSYNPSSVISKTLYIDTSTVYTLSVLADPAQWSSSARPVICWQTATGYSSQPLDIWAAPWVVNDPNYKASSAPYAQTFDLTDLEGWNEQDNDPFFYNLIGFRPTRYVVTFTTPSTLVGNKFWIVFRDTRTSNASRSLYSQIQFERGNFVTDWSTHPTEVSAGGVQITYDGINIFGDAGLSIYSVIDSKEVNVKLNTSEGLAFYQKDNLGEFIKRGGLSIIKNNVVLSSQAFQNPSKLDQYFLWEDAPNVQNLPQLQMYHSGKRIGQLSADSMGIGLMSIPDLVGNSSNVTLTASQFDANPENYVSFQMYGNKTTANYARIVVVSNPLTGGGPQATYTFSPTTLTVSGDLTVNGLISGNVLRNDVATLTNQGVITVNNNDAGFSRVSNTSGSAGFPTTYGYTWFFGGSEFGRDFAIYKQRVSDNWWLGSINSTRNGYNNWNQIWHSGNTHTHDAGNITTGTIPVARGVFWNESVIGLVGFTFAGHATSGRFNSGSTNPTSTARLNAPSYFYATRFYSTTNTLYSFSDIRTKQNIFPLEKEIELILQLEPISYQLKPENDVYLEHSKSELKNGFKYPDVEHHGQNHYGFIAQDVEKLMDKLGIINNAIVDKPTATDEYYSIDYASFVAPMVKTIQHLNEKITILENKISEGEE